MHCIEPFWWIQELVIKMCISGFCFHYHKYTVMDWMEIIMIIIIIFIVAKPLQEFSEFIRSMNTEQCQTAMEPWTKPTNWCHESTCRLLVSAPTIAILLLLRQKLLTAMLVHRNLAPFTIPHGVEDWVDLGTGVTVCSPKLKAVYHGWCHDKHTASTFNAQSSYTEVKHAVAVV